MFNALDQTVTRIPFNGSPNPTVGVEMEIQIIDPESRNLHSGSVDIVERLGDHPRIKPELTQSTIEVITGICKNVAEVRADFKTSLAELYDIGDELGFTYSAAGTHPFAQWREQTIYPNDRYQQLVNRLQWPARKLMIYGLHVHVGVASGEKAIAIGNALTSYIPHLLSLSASSPFVDFEDTGLASARSKIFEAMPTAGLPFRLANYTEFQTFMNALIKANAISSIQEIWWDIRPHPRFGTIEVRVCDIPSTLTETCALTAFVQCLIVWLNEHYDNGTFGQLLRPWIVRENKWRSARFGIDTDIIIDNTGRRAPLRDEIARLLYIFEPLAQKLDCAEELQHIHTVLRKGASYERQRALYQETQDFKAVIDHLSAAFRQDIFDD